MRQHGHEPDERPKRERFYLGVGPDTDRHSSLPKVRLTYKKCYAINTMERMKIKVKKKIVE